MEHSEARFHISYYGVYILVWLALVILTGITVFVAGLNVGHLTVLAALFIAALKSTLVLSYFMHLKYERGGFHILIPLVLVTLAIFLGLTFSDVAFR